MGVYGAKCMARMGDPSRTCVLKSTAPYVKGDEPLDRPIPWACVDSIIGVANLNGEHWVAYAVELDLERIVVYDSLCRTEAEWHKVKMQFKEMSEYVPWLIQEEFVCVQRDRELRNTEEWDVIWYPAAPQQDNFYDCGVMAVKFFECLAAGIPVSFVEPHRCREYREAYVSDAWKLKLEARLNNIGQPDLQNANNMELGVPEGTNYSHTLKRLTI